MSADLTAFLRERLDEDEAGALAAGDDDANRTWTGSDNGYEDGGKVVDGYGATVVYDEGSPDTTQALHIGRHDPARGLREVEAKRAIIDDHRACEEWNERARESRDGEREICITLRALAAIYSDHPGYQPEWALSQYRKNHDPDSPRGNQ